MKIDEYPPFKVGQLIIDKDGDTSKIIKLTVFGLQVRMVSRFADKPIPYDNWEWIIPWRETSTFIKERIYENM